MITTREALDDLLDATSCRACGKKKSTAQSLCKDCYYALPLQMRKDLYKRFGDGYVEAFNAALEYLKKGEGK